jgi:hypothetical protein
MALPLYFSSSSLSFDRKGDEEQKGNKPPHKWEERVIGVKKAVRSLL